MCSSEHTTMHSFATGVKNMFLLILCHKDVYKSSMQRTLSILYCHLWPVHLYHIFPNYLINGMILGRDVEPNICVLIVYTFV